MTAALSSWRLEASALYYKAPVAYDYDLTMMVHESYLECLPDQNWIGSTQGPRLGLYDFELA
jgi:hypothetical protein